MIYIPHKYDIDFILAPYKIIPMCYYKFCSNNKTILQKLKPLGIFKHPILYTYIPIIVSLNITYDNYR